MSTIFKPLGCPFCGKAPVFTADTDITDGFDHSYTIACHECGFHLCDEYKSDVVANWNRRAVAPDLLEALKDLASESKETFAHWPDLKAQVDAAIAKAEGRS